MGLGAWSMAHRVSSIKSRETSRSISDLDFEFAKIVLVVVLVIEKGKFAKHFSIKCRVRGRFDQNRSPKHNICQLQFLICHLFSGTCFLTRHLKPATSDPQPATRNA
jgi:hypothetical protein